MTTESIVNLLLLVSYLLTIIPEAFIDARMKKTSTMYHGPKAAIFIGITGLVMIPVLFDQLPSLWLVISFLIIRKPVFDYTWSLAYGSNDIPFIGSTSLTDKFVRWSGVYEYSKKIKFPIIGMIYITMIFASITLAIHLGRS